MRPTPPAASSMAAWTPTATASWTAGSWPPRHPPAGDLVPWDFDRNHGGWHTARDPQSVIGTSAATLPLWHYMTSGKCGFQTQSRSNCVLANGTPGYDPDGAGASPCVAIPAGLTGFVGGMWHTGNGTATADATDCGNYGIPFDTATPTRAELLLDVLFSPVIQKVHQGTDSNGFPYTVEFQRLGYNTTVQFDGSTTFITDIDNDIDDPAPNVLMGENLRGDGISYYLTRLLGPGRSLLHHLLLQPDDFRADHRPGQFPLDLRPVRGRVRLPGLRQRQHQPVRRQAQDPRGARQPAALPRPQRGPRGRGHAWPGRRATWTSAWWATRTTACSSTSRGTPATASRSAWASSPSRPPWAPASGDYGVGIDDVVFEWDEVHPVPESDRRLQPDRRDLLRGKPGRAALRQHLPVPGRDLRERPRPDRGGPSLRHPLGGPDQPL